MANKKEKWNIDNIPDQSGRIVIVTGSTSGIGKETNRVLASKNAHVIMAIRNLEKGERVANEIRNNHPNAHLSLRKLDLTSLKSIHEFAEGFIKEYDKLDILINNAGIMSSSYSKTEDGFEMQMGTNHLGHFALTGLMVPLLKKTPDSRIVSVSSMTYKYANIDLNDINWENRKYKSNKAYAASKLADLYFIYEMARRFRGDKNYPKVIAAHPGWTGTNIQSHIWYMKYVNKLFAQNVTMGALPTLRAAIDPAAESGDFYGPSKFMHMRGPPVKEESNAHSHDEEIAQKLWELSEKLTEIKF